MHKRSMSTMLDPLMQINQEGPINMVPETPVNQVHDKLVNKFDFNMVRSNRDQQTLRLSFSSNK